MPDTISPDTISPDTISPQYYAGPDVVLRHLEICMLQNSGRHERPLKSPILDECCGRVPSIWKLSATAFAQCRNDCS
jgi:hypothetical protein